MMGQVPVEGNIFSAIHGIVELDDDGIPVLDFVTGSDVEWDGWPVEDTGLRYTMSTFNDGGPPVEQSRQSVKLFKYQAGATVFLAVGRVTIHHGQPDSARVRTEDGRVYVTKGEWIPVEGSWVCNARLVQVLTGGQGHRSDTEGG